MYICIYIPVSSTMLFSGASFHDGLFSFMILLQFECSILLGNLAFG